MSTRWSAGEFRRVRVAAVAATGVAWTVWIALPSRSFETGERAPWEVVGIVFGVVAAAVAHAGLIVSFRVEQDGWAERAGWVERVAAAVLMLPFLLFGSIGIVFAWSLQTPAAGWQMAVFVPYLALHLVQLWRMAGGRFPRLQPIMSRAAPTSGTITLTETHRG